MLRSLVLILLFANAAFFAWSRGWLDEVVGIQPDAQHEPQRLAQQINPEQIVVTAALPASVPAPDEGALPGVAPEPPAEPASDAASAPTGGSAAPGEPAQAPASAALTPPSPLAPPVAGAETPAASAAVTAAAAGICLEAGPFSTAEYTAAEAVVRPLLRPSGVAWTRQPAAAPGMWLVYMGPYAEAELLQRKQDELKRIKGLEFEVVRTPPPLAQGISLGRFSKRENAENQLETLRNRGIRTARIVNQRPASELLLLRVPRADTAAQTRLAGAKLPQGKGFAACRS